MKKKTVIIILILGIAIGSYIFFDFSSAARVEILKTEAIAAQPIKKEQEARTELFFTATENSTVYDLMQKLKTQGEINFTEKNYIGMGKIIISINGIKSNGQKTWIYYVNGEKADMGISNYQVIPGDIVAWKYEAVKY
ncbi:MAG: DUF4430 domain-containing protein [Candidatus Paceibacterota bacterium]|jgi:hypothetical protein